MAWLNEYALTSNFCLGFVGSLETAFGERSHGESAAATAESSVSVVAVRPAPASALASFDLFSTQFEFPKELNSEITLDRAAVKHFCDAVQHNAQEARGPLSLWT